MENPTIGKQEKIRSFQIRSDIVDGLRAYGIEGDKIPFSFQERIREFCEKYAKFPYVAGEHNQELWIQAAKRNPSEEGELKREEIFQYIEDKLGMKFSSSDRAGLKELFWGIMDDEDVKRKERSNL